MHVYLLQTFHHVYQNMQRVRNDFFFYLTCTNWMFYLNGDLCMASCV